MVKKRGQGQKYPQDFTKNQILIKLCEKDRTSTTEIFDFLRDKQNISEQKNIRETHLKRLEKQKLIKKESAGLGHPTYWSVVSDIKTLKELVERLKSDHNLLHAVMRSWYYLGMISLMCDHFQSVLQDAGLPEMNGTEIKFLELNLKCSESCLFFVLNKTSSECKKSFEGMAGSLGQMKENYKQTINKFPPNKIAAVTRDIVGIKTLKKIPQKKFLERVDAFIDLAVGDPSWIKFFGSLSMRDRCLYGFWLHPDDEKRLNEIVIDLRLPAHITAQTSVQPSDTPL